MERGEAEFHFLLAVMRITTREPARSWIFLSSGQVLRTVRILESAALSRVVSPVVKCELCHIIQAPHTYARHGSQDQPDVALQQVRASDLGRVYVKDNLERKASRLIALIHPLTARLL